MNEDNGDNKFLIVCAFVALICIIGIAAFADVKHYNKQNCEWNCSIITIVKSNESTPNCFPFNNLNLTFNDSFYSYIKEKNVTCLSSSPDGSNFTGIIICGNNLSTPDYLVPLGNDTYAFKLPYKFVQSRPEYYTGVGN